MHDIRPEVSFAMSQDSVQCSDCGFLLSELPGFAELVECPKCGSGNRHITVTDTLKIHEQDRLTVKDPLKTGKKRIRRSVVFGDDLHIKSGKWYEKTRIIDRENNYYLERIIDPETGEAIYFCEESLSEHQNHGSAKSRSCIEAD